MALTDALVVLAVFAGFVLLIWSRMSKRNSPIIQKIREWFKKKEIKEKVIDSKDQWYPPSIERKIN